LPEIVQDIGAYAGIASVVGLAVLSVLYFSQARDVKRLREWAGRAPERAELGTGLPQPTPGKAMPQPHAQQQAKPQAGPQPAKAPAVPAAAGAAAAGAAAAATQQKQDAAPKAPAAPAPATAGAGANAAAKPAAATAQSGAAPTALKQETPAPAKPAGNQGAPAAAQPNTGAPPVPGAPKPATSAASGGGQGGPPVAPPQSRPQPAGRPAPQPTQIIPPESESWHQRIFGSTRNLILAICGVVLLGAGVALALTQLSGDDAGTPSADQPAQEQQGGQNDGGGGGGNGQGQGRQERRNRPAIDPSTVTVSVLNGTTVPGLAARVSDEVETAGFEVGTVANSSDQQRAESVILFAPGHEREAAVVSRKLDIAQREPIDAATQGLAGDATVVVVTGADRS
jgi:LytR cell envelope-related transcriptional attenuator